MPTPVKCTHMWELFPAVRPKKAAEAWRRRKAKKRKERRKKRGWTEGRASGRRRNMCNIPLCYLLCPATAWPVWTSLCPLLQRPGCCPAHQPLTRLHLWPHRPTLGEKRLIIQRRFGRGKMFQRQMDAWESRQTWQWVEPKQPPRRTCTCPWIPFMKALTRKQSHREVSQYSRKP